MNTLHTQKERVMAMKVSTEKLIDACGIEQLVISHRIRIIKIKSFLRIPTHGQKVEDERIRRSSFKELQIEAEETLVRLNRLYSVLAELLKSSN